MTPLLAGNTMEEISKLTASDAASNDSFGYSVAISGDTAVIGAYDKDDMGQADSGSAYIFQYNPQSKQFEQVAKLTRSDLAAGDIFGFSVAISGDTVAIGAHQNDADDYNSGAVYIYQKPVSGWTDMNQTAKLVASDGANGDFLGYSVAIDGDTVVSCTMGNIHSAYVFQKPVSGWANTTQTAKLSASDGIAGDQFGISVAISGDTVVVGAYEEEEVGNNSTGSAYVFVKPASGWMSTNETAKLTASDAENWDFFGKSVAIDGDTIAISAFGDDEGGNYNVGSVYIFEKPPTGWETTTQDAKLTASDAFSDDNLGLSVSINGDRVVAGSYDANNAYAGAAYLFKKPPSGWSDSMEDAKFTASDIEAGDTFGFSVSISGNRALIGSYCDDDAGFCSGSAYVFKEQQHPVISPMIMLLLD
jgi:hypothetical protein